MNGAKVSVVIPVYNTAAYLRDAVKSVINQTLRELEIIIVNDGSTDNSGAIIRDLANEDRRIRIVEQENKGLSEARNTGLRYVTGEFIYFMDSDDLLDLDCLELCYNRCIESRLDFVCFDAETIVESGVGTPLQNYTRKGLLDENKIYKGKELFEKQMEQFIFRPSVWLTFVRVDFMHKCFFGFYPGIIHEDHLFTVPLYLHARRVGYIARAFFKRRVRANSIMNKTFSIRNMEGYRVTACELSDLAKRHGNFKTLIWKYLQQMLNAVIWEAHKLPFAYKISVFMWLFTDKYWRCISLRNYAVFWLKKK